ncbi:MAG: Do family serine endopeptidase, partial [Candidatus Omnitrophota bacterium]
QFEAPFGGSPFGGEEDSFRRFFEDFFGNLPDSGREYKQTGLGSGVIIDAQGYILTNEHVIKDADRITVKLPDGREFKAEVKGQDARSDLAVIKINAKELPVAMLGNSEDIKIGAWVVAIGNPFGFALQNPEPTVTAGVISALHRSLGRVSGDRYYNDLIQTDAAINPGNSGGPLVNLKGEIIGINVAIFSTTGGYQGIGFAIPINDAKRIISRLIEGKEILYGWLGVTVQDLTGELAEYFGLADKNGVLVAAIMKDSPADKAGIKESDVIKKFDNKTVNNTRELLAEVGKTEVGKKVKVAVIRDKKELLLDVEVAKRPEDLEKLMATGAGISDGAWRGLKLEELTPEIKRRFNIREDAGLVVTDVEPASHGDEAGIIAGDIILEINKQPVRSIAEFERLTKAVKGNCLVRASRGYFLVKGD